MQIALAQLNPTVGDLAGNADYVLRAVQKSEKAGVGLTVFPELFLTGYPPEDLLLKPAFIQDNIKVLKFVASRVKNSAALVGFVDHKNGALFNAAAWIEKGKIRKIYHKMFLPNYGVFDEKRYFQKGSQFFVHPYQGVRVAVTICEDLWMGPKSLESLKTKKPDLVINLSASPYHSGKLQERVTIIQKSMVKIKKPVLYCNLIGGQDELVFDGGSFILNSEGRTVAQCPEFKSGVFYFDIDPMDKSKPVFSLQKNPAKFSLVEEIYEALLLGIQDYVNKNGFQKVTLGLSGGIDSALVAALAVHALGKDRVVGVTMPSKFNQKETRTDAKKLAKNLQIDLIEIPIEKIYSSFENSLAPSFKKTWPGLAEENLQARIRGNLLMALSNKFGWLVLTTGNKSETSVGYCTLYGDMAGGFAVLKDVYKSTVYQLADFINKKMAEDVIPKSIIKRPPTAELRHNQKDEDSLGSYSNLDPILVGYVENNLPMSKLAKKTRQKLSYTEKILNLIDKNEYKRRQSPPGIKISPRAFGRDHRMPITNQYSRKK